MVVKKNFILEITNLATPKKGLILRISQISFKRSLTKWLLNDQANQDKGFIRMQNQVESVTTVF